MSAFEETVKAYITQTQKDPTSVWTTTPPPSPAPKNLLEMIRAAKEKLVKSQRYDDAKDLRDIERLLMEKLGNEPVVLNDIEAILDHVREAKNASARAEEGVALTEGRIEKLEKNPLANFVHINDDGHAVIDTSVLPAFDAIIGSNDAFKKLEKALSDEMSRTREMEGTIAGMVIDVARLKRYEYVDVPMPVTVGGDNVYQVIDPTDGVTKEDDIIRKDELLKWLDIEIAMAEENLEQAQTMVAGIRSTTTTTMQAMLATYKAVKAHIEG